MSINKKALATMKQIEEIQRRSELVGNPKKDTVTFPLRRLVALTEETKRLHEEFESAVGCFVRYMDVTADKCAKWISVDEELPENDRFVLVYGERLNEVDIGWLHNNVWHAELVTYENEDVEYWMPLPEPPKEEEQ